MNNDLISRENLLNEFDTKCQRICPTCEYHKWNPELNRYECELINTAPTVEQNWRFYYDHGYKQAERDLKRVKNELKTS